MPPLILVVDDSAEMQLLLQVRLQPEGWRLAFANDAQTGLHLAKSEKPDLMLLDMTLPDGNGIDICRALKADPQTQSIAVLFLSASSAVSDKVLAFDAGAADFVQKPFNAEELRARIRAALRAKRYLELLAERAHVDGMTGLWNRAHFDARLEVLLSTANRYRRAMALILFDIDFFKAVNDQHGHPFGDRVLQSIGDVLQKSSRAADSACRYGGEEFAMLLPETQLEGAVLLAERIRKRVSLLLFDHHQQHVQVTISAGVAAVGPAEGYDAHADSFLGRVDKALYAAKGAGRNCVASAPPPVDREPNVP